MAARAGELGLAVTPCPPAGSTPTDAQVRHRHGRRTPAPWTLTGDASTSHRTGRLRVVDLSALWAGPLLGALLARFGASVVKVEDPRRGDASRRRPTALTRDLNRSKQLVPASFDGTGRDRLARLLADADIVIEGARPRVLDGLGLGPAHGLGAGQIWISITAHGRSGPWSGRVGFGDDCAAGGGLYHAGRGWPGFVGDAVADPLTGLHGTVAVLAARLGGWSGHIDMALRDTAASVTAGAGSTASEASG
jgi:crotonobetainyl-CoA:carnitine CoA-transferase CaiB-like acyl-CoA transferase